MRRHSCCTTNRPVFSAISQHSRHIVERGARGRCNRHHGAQRNTNTPAPQRCRLTGNRPSWSNQPANGGIDDQCADGVASLDCGPRRNGCSSTPRQQPVKSALTLATRPGRYDFTPGVGRSHNRRPTRLSVVSACCVVLVSSSGRWSPDGEGLIELLRHTVRRDGVTAGSHGGGVRPDGDRTERTGDGTMNPLHPH